MTVEHEWPGSSVPDKVDPPLAGSLNFTFDDGVDPCLSVRGVNDALIESDLLEVSVWRSEKGGALVVQVDTEGEAAERLRVKVNECTVFDARPEAGDHHLESLEDYYRDLDALFRSVNGVGEPRGERNDG